MANSAGIYLQLDKKILLLCDESWGLVPRGIGIPGYKKAAKMLALEPGDPVSCRDGCLHFAGGWIKIAQTEEPAPDFGGRICTVQWQTGLQALCLRGKGLAPGAKAMLAGERLAALDPLCTLALPRLKQLRQGLLEEDPTATEAGARDLLGLGPGLTPSGDDVLCGLVYGLLRSPCAQEQGVKALVNTVCREAEHRTHPVSAAYLQAIAGGEAFGRLEEAWQILKGQRDGTFDPLLEVGSSSGGDLLLGLLLAASICMEREEETNG